MIRDCLIMTGVGFVSGAVMFSYLLPKLFFHVDVRAGTEDLNPGSSNAIRAVGLPFGLLCMFLDVLKAFLPVWIAVNFLYINDWQLIPVTVAPVLGHAFSPMLGFKGGKAVSTSFGALLGLWHVSKIICLLVLAMAFFRFVIVINPDSHKVVVAMITACLLALFFDPLPAATVALAGIGIIVTVKMLMNPNRGEWSIHVWRYALTHDEGWHFHFGRS